MGGFARKTREFLGFPTSEDDSMEFYDIDFTHEEESSDVVDFSSYEHEDKPVAATRPSASKMTPVHTELSRILTVHPATFDEVEVLGTAYRQGTPVIANLTELPDDEARRILDFMSGLSFALEGHLERVTNRVFLLSPQAVEVERESSRAGYGRVFN